jgi:hypothetical protein
VVDFKPVAKMLYREYQQMINNIECFRRFRKPRGTAAAEPWHILREIVVFQLTQCGCKYKQGKDLMERFCKWKPVSAHNGTLRPYSAPGWSEAIKKLERRLEEISRHASFLLNLATKFRVQYDKPAANPRRADKPSSVKRKN